MSDEEVPSQAMEPEDEEQQEQQFGSPSRNNNNNNNNDVASDEEETVDQDEDEQSNTSTAGWVEQVNLTNFMLHENLKVQFRRNVNFIVGQNGSGKSAVLVAITIGLGGGTKFTERAERLDSFIRAGAQQCTIKITLNNEGADGYQQEKYGNSIIVERKINRGTENKSGTSSYKLKGANGRVVAETKIELENLLDHFNIQVGNPVAILMQDTSKTFLAESKDENKYKFFSMATQLERMAADFQEIDTLLTALKKLIATKERLFQDMTLKIQQYQKEYNEVKDLQDLEVKIKAVRNELAWAIVRESDMEVTAAQRKVEKMIALITDKTKKKLDYETSFQDSRTRVTDVRAAAERKIEEVRTANLKRVEIESQAQDVKRRLHLAEQEYQKLVYDIDNLEKRIERRQKHINEQKEAFNRNDIDDKRAEKEALFKSKSEEQKRLQEDLDNKRGSRQDLQSKIQEKFGQVEEVKRRIEMKRSEDAKQTEQLRDLKSKEGGIVALLGRDIQSIVQLIEQNKNLFKVPPVGPIAFKIRSKSDKWATAIEPVIFQSLKSFVCANATDLKALKDLCKRFHKDQPSLIAIENDQLYRIPDSQYRTILSELECDNPRILNALVSAHEIERKVLVDTIEEGDRIVFADKSQNTERILEAWVVDGTRIENKQGSKNTIPPQHARKFLNMSVEDRTKKIQQQQHYVRKDIANFEAELREIQKQKNEVEKQADTFLRGMKGTEDKLRRLNDELSSLDDEIKQLVAPQNQPDSLLAEENALDALKQDLGTLKSKTTTSDQRRVQIKQEMAPFQQKMKEQDVVIRKLTEESEQIQQESRSAEQGAAQGQAVIDKIQREIDAFKMENDRENAALAEKKQKLEDRTEKARAIAPQRIETTKQPGELIAERDAMQAKLESDRRHLNAAEIIKRYKDGKTKYRETNEMLKKFKNQQQALTSSLHDRMKRWAQFQKSLARRTNLYFASMMTSKGHTGELIFDHNKKTLKLSVQMDVASRGRKTQDVNTLSGGEKSYSTVSLLLSLWEVMETPFRAMDEFDVFMDSINRSVSLKLLLEHAKQNPFVQFIFITPHDYNEIMGTNAHVIKMFPPIRGQSQLRFTAAESEQ